MKVVIADDHAVVRSGFAMIINFQEDMEVVATAADGIEAYKMVAKHRPDILLMDLSMPPGESGLIATAKIHEDFPETNIIILTMHDDEEYLFHVLKKGARGYVLKNSPDEQLVSAIRMVHQGGVYIHPKLASSLVREFVSQDQQADENNPYQLLSTREVEILPLVAKGYGNKEIAEMLHISVKTVEAHKAKIMEKLNLKSRPELVEYAIKKKLLDF
ncbi:MULTISPECIES: response regulator [Paenibacillus]|uniref:response regulator n=1 Tax=Paenibacillus TaxID=44249 RepID=UPI0004B320A1|nr:MULTISPECIES: response regulator transcription factor [Paenibacillus]MCT2194050.1 response regulator transcription factor [Paenibacillus sp. p3-SID1389]MDU0331444.1 response regulator transcription factor [Paenibacillus sp. 3LSP]MEC2345442.1 response regulator transcription factor [Paenibacillus barengoltzii]SMF53430.1 two component transcriptional regulator, LuxR family [Paenibacillus barengoltzii]